MIVNTVNDPAGIWMLGKRCLSMEFAWIMENDCWNILSRIMIPEEQIGMTLRTALRNSTWSMVQSFHGFEA